MPDEKALAAVPDPEDLRPLGHEVIAALQTELSEATKAEAAAHKRVVWLKAQIRTATRLAGLVG